MIKIRPIQDGDWAEWLRLRCELWPHSTPAELEDEMAHIQVDLDRNPIFVAERPEGDLCGLK